MVVVVLWVVAIVSLIAGCLAVALGSVDYIDDWWVGAGSLLVFGSVLIVIGVVGCAVMI